MCFEIVIYILPPSTKDSGRLRGKALGEEPWCRSCCQGCRACGLSVAPVSGPQRDPGASEGPGWSLCIVLGEERRPGDGRGRAGRRRHSFSSRSVLWPSPHLLQPPAESSSCSHIPSLRGPPGLPWKPPPVPKVGNNPGSVGLREDNSAPAPPPGGGVRNRGPGACPPPAGTTGPQGPRMQVCVQKRGLVGVSGFLSRFFFASLV